MEEHDVSLMSENNWLKIVMRFLGMADDSYSEQFKKGILRDLRLLRTRNYKVGITMSVGETLTRCTVVIVDKSAGLNLVRRSWPPRQ